MSHATERSTRSAHTALEIAAPAEAVWQALTEPAEIVRWFALDAEVKPGAGGAVTWRWADLYRWDTRIELWEPLRRLRLAYTQSKIGDHAQLGGAVPESEAGYDLVVDFQLEAVAGGTWLRCVHSGFGRDASWDDELEGVRKGWLGELEALRYYLERHRGQARRAWWALARPGVPVVEAWRALAPRPGFGRGLIATGPDGTLRLDVPGLEAPLVPLRLDPPGDMTVRVPAWNDALLRIWNDPQGPDGSMVSVFASHYGPEVAAERPEARAALRAALRDALRARDEDITVVEA